MCVHTLVLVSQCIRTEKERETDVDTFSAHTRSHYLRKRPHKRAMMVWVFTSPKGWEQYACSASPLTVQPLRRSISYSSTPPPVLATPWYIRTLATYCLATRYTYLKCQETLVCWETVCARVQGLERLQPPPPSIDAVLWWEDTRDDQTIVFYICIRIFIQRERESARERWCHATHLTAWLSIPYGLPGLGEECVALFDNPKP